MSTVKTSIAFLDASTVDYGDISFAALNALGEFSRHDRTAPAELSARMRGVHIAITNKVVFDAKAIESCDALKMIAVAATGYNTIDIEAATGRGIAVANVPAYSTRSVAQFTMAHILALATRLMEYNAASHDGTWSRSPIFTLGTWPTFELKDKVIGILGLGAIGREVARLAAAFGMKVLALKREGISYEDSFERAGLYDIAGRADFVAIHLPLNSDTTLLIDERFISRMKSSAFLINMARGSIVDTRALARALHSGKIAGAALDVIEQEPPPPDHVLLGAPRCIITPHIAWAGRESRERLVAEIAENIRAFLAGTRRSRIDFG